ncbi:hypothetical protein [Streptomyces sp. NPDC057580]|uniref:hypothetical protein n=1 Tax=Streptomyces sp. NPDC057580 TaxID=3346173 RepID=UPI0036970B20
MPLTADDEPAEMKSSPAPPLTLPSTGPVRTIVSLPPSPLTELPAWTDEHLIESLPAVPFTVGPGAGMPLTVHDVAAWAGVLMTSGAMTSETAQSAHTECRIM